MGARPTALDVVRRVRATELARVYRIFRATLPNISPRTCRYHLTRERGVYVLDVRGVGVAGFYIATLKDSSTTLWVEYLGVDPEHQGRGLGRVLVEHCERLGRDVGSARVGLRPRDAGAQAFYERLGYVAEGPLEDGHPRLYKPLQKGARLACDPRSLLGRYNLTNPFGAVIVTVRCVLLAAVVTNRR